MRTPSFWMRFGRALLAEQDVGGEDDADAAAAELRAIDVDGRHADQAAIVQRNIAMFWRRSSSFSAYSRSTSKNSLVSSQMSSQSRP